MPAAVVSVSRMNTGVEPHRPSPPPLAIVRYDAEPIPAAVDASWRTYPAGSTRVYLANPGDLSAVIPIAAAAGSPLAGPVLFTNTDGSLPEATMAEIGRLQATAVTALGNELLISATALEQAVEAARTAAKAGGYAHEDDVTVETWQGEGLIGTSTKIAQSLFPEGAERIYLVPARTPGTIALAALAGSARRGPVLLVDPNDLAPTQAAIAQLDPEYVVSVGELEPAISDKLAKNRKKTALTAGSMNALALNIASTRRLDEAALAVAASVDDPVSLLLAAQLATGPMVTVGPEITVEEATKIVRSANELSHAKGSRFIAVGRKGTENHLFQPRPPQTLTGALTSADVIGTGKGTFTTVPVPSGLAVGKGPVFRYKLKIEDGLPVDHAAFAVLLSQILNDPRGWGRNFVQVESGPVDTNVMLSSPPQVDVLCAPLDTLGETSCNIDDRTVLNIKRWAYGATPFLQAGGNLEQYRQYVVNHEIGHAQGFGHEPPGRVGSPAPVMLQQTLDMQGCAPNGWPNP
ncbi:MAG: DUF3152 domain-containing protein [Actinomycetaceae bacterium]|nr:DUF3152 domain-containing protein [Actinomycetaceae bacterium]